MKKHITQILAIEESPVILECLLGFLEECGYEVLHTADGQTGLDYLANHRIDLVLMDVDLPDIDGLDLLQRINSHEGEQQLPVLIISDIDDMQSIVKGLELGAIDFLPKSCEPVILRAKIESCLERGRALERAHYEKRRSDELLDVAIPIGVALSEEADFNRLLETILSKTKQLCHADAATFYLRTPDDKIGFVAAECDSLNIKLSAGAEGSGIFKPLNIFVDGQPNRNSGSAYVAATGAALNIPDVYKN
jgi:DNA-binding response OmpR family regulator